MVSGNKEITANFSSPPFQQRQAKTPVEDILALLNDPELVFTIAARSPRSSR